MSKRLNEREINAVKTMRQDGHTLAEIAAIMGVSVSAIDMTVNPEARARKNAWNRGYYAGLKAARNK